MKKYLNIVMVMASWFCCSFTLTTYGQCSNAPVLTLVTPNTGFVGSTVTISGAFFDPVPANNQVWFGATQATILTSSFGSMTVTVPVGATTSLVSVKNSCNKIAYSKVPFNGIFCPTPLTTTTYQNVAFTLSGIVGSYNMMSQDIDGDGKPDIISEGFGSNFTIARNTSTPGSLSFTSHFVSSPGPRSVAVADFDGDGKIDILSNGYVHRNLSTPGTISMSAAIYVGNTGYQCAAGDINGDGKIDAISGNGNDIIVCLNTSTGPGVISFSAPINVSNVGSHTTGLQAVDIDGDGKTDVLGTQGGSDRAFTLRNITTTGSSTPAFEAPEFWASNGSYPYRCQIADFDKDGKIDLTTCNFSGTANTAVFRNTSTPGNISFATAFTMAAPSSNYRIAVGDVNGDGLPDVVTKSSGTNVFSVYTNTSSGPGVVAFGARIDYTSSAQAEVSGIVIGDLDGDFVPDIGTSGSSSNALRIHRNTSSQVDVTPPTALCKNIIVGLGQTGNVNVVAAMIDNGSSDACGIESLLINGQPSMNFTCADIGPNNVTLTVIDRAGNQSTCTAVVTVAPAAIIVAGQTTVCEGQSVLMTANLGDSYQWFKDGVFIAGAISQNYNATETGNYTVAVTNAGGCSGTSAATVVTISTVTQATTTLSGSPNICQGNTITITASAGSAYSWSNGATSQSITVTVAGTYTVTVYDANGCTSTAAPVVVTIIAGGLPDATVTPDGPTIFCSGGNVNLSASAAASYLWSTGATTQSINVTQSGTYSVQVTNAAGCFKVSSGTVVTVKPSPSVVAGNNVTICATPAQLNAVGNSNGATAVPQVTNYCFFDAPGGSGNCNFVSDLCGDGYVCMPNASYTQNITAPNISGLNFKLYYTCNVVTFTFKINGNVLGTSSDAGLGCTCSPAGVGTYPKTVSFTAAQLAGLWTGGTNVVTVEMNSQSSTCLSGIVAEVLTPGELYSWSPAAGLSDPNIANPIANPAATTTYTVTYTSSNGCTATSQVVVTVQCNTTPVAVCQAVNVSANGNCQGTAVATDFNGGSSDPDGDPVTFSVSPAGPYPVGITNVTLTVTDDKGASSTCQTAITVNDNEAPVITVSDILACFADYDFGNSINPLATATDNCPGVTIAGIRSDALALGDPYPVGVTTITWTATDIHNNASIATQLVTRNPEINISICAGPTLTIYGGTAGGFGPFGPQSVNLTATASGGTPGYSYSWSPAAGLSNPNIANPIASPTVTTTYILTVTDSKNCTRSLGITVNVLPLSSLVCSGTGNNTKFTVCHVPPGNPPNPQTICISGNAVNAHLVTGSVGHKNCYLGPCRVEQLCFSTTPGAQSKAAPIEDVLVYTEETPVDVKEDFSVQAYPNPSTSDFSLRVTSKSNEPVTARVLDVNGVVRSVNLMNPKTNAIIVGSNLKAGTYMVEVTQGTNRKVVKLIKMN